MDFQVPNLFHVNAARHLWSSLYSVHRLLIQSHESMCSNYPDAHSMNAGRLGLISLLIGGKY